MQNIATESLKVGDIIEHTGGYNSTRTQFYSIVAVSKSGKKVSVRRLNTVQVSGDWMNGAVAPIEGSENGDTNELMVKTGYNGEVMLRGRIHSTIRNEDGSVKWVNTGSLENFYKWSGNPKWNNCD